MRKPVLIVALLVLYTRLTSAQQVGVLTRNAVLRSEPSSSANKLATLEAGEAVTLLGNGRQAGYLRVRTQTEDVGWVWERFVRLVDPTELHQPTPLPAPVPTPASPQPPTSPHVAQGDFDSCPDSGTAQLVSIRPLNRLKNRSAEPRDADVDSSVTLAAMLAPSSNDAGRFAETKAAEISGFVFRVIPGGRTETTNCRKGDPVHRDTHIELTKSPTDTAEIQRVIVEVTPRWRAGLKGDGTDWSTATLQQTIERRWIKVRGWLLFDTEHKAQAENTNPGGTKNWRATAWEIHPITSIVVVSQP